MRSCARASAFQRANSGQAGELPGFGFLFTLRPFHNSRIANLNQLLFLQAF